LVPGGHSDETSGYLARRADALYRQGDELGDNPALIKSITIWRESLQLTPRDRVRLDWAGTQMNLGNALKTLGERESGTARLEEAVVAYRASLEERRRDRVPFDWALTQMNLGAALSTLGERISSDRRR
jgi:tetratricopeptide (TPR) repeat protein